MTYLSPARRFVLGGEVFPTKKTVQDRCKTIRGPYKPGNPRTITDSREIAFLRDLLDLHPNAETKRGAGVEGFRIADDLRLGVCFWVDRIDGSSTDFSFNECLDKENPWADFRAAARAAVLDQVLEFKAANLVLGETRCAASGVLLEQGLTHVDHVAPHTFEVLLHEFVQETGLVWGRVPLTSGLDGNTTKEMQDPKVRSDWAQFHRERAVLRLVTRSENLGGPKLIPRAPQKERPVYPPLPAEWDYLFGSESEKE